VSYQGPPNLVRTEFVNKNTGEVLERDVLDEPRGNPEIRQRRLRNIFDFGYQGQWSAKRAARLIERLQSEKHVLKFDLTYGRPVVHYDGSVTGRDEYETMTAEQLYDLARAKQHVARFHRRFCKHLGCKPKDLPWCVKKEFQVNGNLHFHIIVPGVQWIDQETLGKLWGHGFVWVRRARQKEIRYVCKYISKSEHTEFLLQRRPGSFRAISTSPGFFAPTRRPALDPDREIKRRPCLFKTYEELLIHTHKDIEYKDPNGYWHIFKGIPIDLAYLIFLNCGIKPAGLKGWRQQWSCGVHMPGAFGVTFVFRDDPRIPDILHVIQEAVAAVRGSGREDGSGGGCRPLYLIKLIGRNLIHQV